LSGRVLPLIPEKAFGGVKDRYHKLLRLLLAEAPEARLSVQKVLDDPIFSESNRTLLDEISGNLEDINTVLRALSGALSSFREEALAGIDGVRTNTAEGEPWLTSRPSCGRADSGSRPWAARTRRS